jgi:2-dehydro-3-deoxygluconokinase
MERSTTGRFKLSVVTFGEALFRMSPPRGVRWENTQTLAVHLGGTELNIAANLVSLGTASRWVSILPQGDAGEMMRRRLLETGVEITIPYTAKGEPGWYMLEEGARPRGDRVLTRVKSVLGHLPQIEIDWVNLLKGARWFHTSGVSAGLSEASTAAVLAALKAAKTLGIPTSYDLNFRATLWDHATSLVRQTPLLPYIDVLVCSESELKHYGNALSNKTLLIPRRDELETSYGLEVRTGGEGYLTRMHQVDITDRIGVGDSMLAGWIHAQLKGDTKEISAEFAAAAGALKYSVVGDQARLNEKEVRDLAEKGFKAMKR